MKAIFTSNDPLGIKRLSMANNMEIKNMTKKPFRMLNVLVGCEESQVA